MPDDTPFGLAPAQFVRVVMDHIADDDETRQRRLELFRLIATEPSMSTAEYAERLGCAEWRVTTDLNALYRYIGEPPSSVARNFEAGNERRLLHKKCRGHNVPRKLTPLGRTFFRLIGGDLPDLPDVDSIAQHWSELASRLNILESWAARLAAYDGCEVPGGIIECHFCDAEYVPARCKAGESGVSSRVVGGYLIHEGDCPIEQSRAIRQATEQGPSG